MIPIGSALNKLCEHTSRKISVTTTSDKLCRLREINFMYDQFDTLVEHAIHVVSKKSGILRSFVNFFSNNNESKLISVHTEMTT